VCQERGWKYVVHTDETLPSGYEYTSLYFLSAFRAQSYADPQATDWWLAQLRQHGPLHPSWGVAQANSGSVLDTLYHLLWQGVIAMDWHHPFFYQGDFHPQARIWLSEERPR
jgi:hypothetical protein